MPRPKDRIDERRTQSFNEGEGTLFEGNVISHPQCKSRLYLLCTFKNITKYACFKGSAPQPSPPGEGVPPWPRLAGAERRMQKAARIC